MLGLVDTKRLLAQPRPTILEPACGLIQFLRGMKRVFPQIYQRSRLIGVEINSELASLFLDLKDDKVEFVNHDFLVWEPGMHFDLIIGNPPYSIPSSSDHYSIKVDDDKKEEYKLLFKTWYGKYNTYGAFIEKAVELLKENGQLIFIVPATFMILDEFKKLRWFLSQNGRTSIIYLGSNVFKPEAEVSCVILNFLRSANQLNRLELFEYKDGKIAMLKSTSCWQGEIILFETEYTKKVDSLCSYKLGDVYDIRISPRTPEIKNSKLVVRRPTSRDDYLPILNSRNLKCNKIIYGDLTGYWIKRSHIGKLRSYFVVPRVVVGLGFRKKGQVASAYDEKCYPWMGDVYHLLKKGDFRDALSEKTLAEYLCSDFVKRYVGDVYRDITYHLSITQLRNLPLPKYKEWKDMRNKLSAWAT